jgi:signal-transduction protein with cAMP-binding, CBS, and nucleotidyltransferase domain
MHNKNRTKENVMPQVVEDVMSPNPTTIPATATIAAAARAMRDHDIGNVVVLQDSKPCGIVTDRDVVVRGLAEGKDPQNTTIAEICSRDLATVSRKDPIEKAVEVMREKNLRRLPVVDNDTVLGVVSIGDLAQERDPNSVLASISAAPANR